MKKILYIILILFGVFLNAESYNFRIGKSTSSQDINFTTEKISKVKFKLNATANQSSFYCIEDDGHNYLDRDSILIVRFQGLAVELNYDNQSKSIESTGSIRVNKGNHNINVSCEFEPRNFSNVDGFFWSAYGTVEVNILGECPNTDECSSNTCEYCHNQYCATHDQHLTGVWTHHENANQPETTHSFCTNDANLLAQWNAQREGTCPDCGKFICKLCPHSCADMPCPNGHYCVPTTCEICHGVYCSRHMLHLCQNYTEANNNTGNENINVQTTITGQAQVSVNITDNTQTLDLSSTNNILNQIENNTRNIDNNTKNLNSKLDSLKSSVDSQTTALSNKLDGVKSEIESQTSSLGGKIDDARSALNDMASQNHQDLNSLLSSVHGDMTGMENNLTSEIGGVTSAIGDTNSTLSEISGKLDNLSLDGDLNVDLGGLGGKIDSTNNKLDTIMNGNGNLGLGTVGTNPAIGGVASELTENTLTGGEIDNITKVTFVNSVKNKLLPPRLNVGNYDASFSFDIPTLFSDPLHLTINMMDEKLQTVRQAVRIVSSLCMVIVFTFGIIRMIRQY